MFKKHYISLLIVVISILGIASQKQVDLPNQEIVVQFDNINVTAEEVNEIISSIKLQLQELGVFEVSISDNNHGELKIAYHSNSDVSSIKNKLVKEGGLTLNLNKKSTKDTNRTPSNNDVVNYDLDVYEIQDYNNNWDFNGINTSSITSKSDHLFNPNIYFSTEVIAIKNNSVTRETYKVCSNVALLINEISHKIPEVRAGPIC